MPIQTWAREDWEIFDAKYASEPEPEDPMGLDIDDEDEQEGDPL